MIQPMSIRPAQALIRFGLGRRGTESVPADPAAWLVGQLDRPAPGTGAQVAEGLRAINEDRRNPPAPGESRIRAVFRTQGNAFLVHAAHTPTPFHERLVWFWTNHFTVSLRRGQCAAVAAAYVEEAIRPHVTGRFETMLLAVMRHPAMLLYLDNVRSVGPNSRANRNGRRGLNENLARECLELHTVSPAAGYTQDDVTALARILTGWTIDFNADPPGFAFNPDAHQPGDHHALGRSFPPGEAGGIEALRFLANHPATHRFLATKLVRHFVADDPVPEAEHVIEGVLRDSKGDLGAAARALTTLDVAWQRFGGKLRSPQELFIAVLRAAGGPRNPQLDLIRPLLALGQPLWTAAAPNGWPDIASAWSTPEMMMRRIDWCHAFATRITPRDPGTDASADPVGMAEAALGPLLRPETREAVARAGSRQDALTLLFTSPEFQRR